MGHLRFQGGTYGQNGFLLKKRMAESVQKDKRNIEAAEQEAAAALGVKDKMDMNNEDPVEDDIDEEEIQRFQVGIITSSIK